MSSATAGTAPPPHIVEDCRGVLRLYSDGSIVRSDNENIFFIPVRDDGKVEWKELQYDPFHDLQLRLYRPCTRNGPNLPVLFYFHGGGFCFGSCTSPRYHNCCLRLAAELDAIVISPDYRLAPEHRLPACIEDGITAVEWLLAKAASTDPDPWLAEDADFSRIFVSGDSAGGNITHHLAIRFALGFGQEGPVRNITGYVQLSPALGGTELTKSEAECPVDAYLTLERTQQYWRLALPLGATADHPLVSPFAPGAPRLEETEIGPTLVVVAGCDLLRDRQVEYAKRLQGWGKPVELVEIPDQQHSFFTKDPWSEPAGELLRVIKRFMDETRLVYDAWLNKTPTSDAES